MKGKDTCRRKLDAFEVDNKRIRILDSAWTMGRNRRKAVDDLYANFSVEYLRHTDNGAKSIHFRGKCSRCINV